MTLPRFHADDIKAVQSERRPYWLATISTIQSALNQKAEPKFPLDRFSELRTANEGNGKEAA